MWLHTNTPVPAQWSRWHSQPRGERFPCAGILSWLQSHQHWQNFSVTKQWRSHTSPPLSAPTGNSSSQLGLARMKTGDGSTTPSCDQWMTCLLCLKQLHHLLPGTPAPYYSEMAVRCISLQRKPHQRLNILLRHYRKSFSWLDSHYPQTGHSNSILWRGHMTSF